MQCKQFFAQTGCLVSQSLLQSSNLSLCQRRAAAGDAWKDRKARASALRGGQVEKQPSMTPVNPNHNAELRRNLRRTPSQISAGSTQAVQPWKYEISPFSPGGRLLSRTLHWAIDRQIIPLLNEPQTVEDTFTALLITSRCYPKISEAFERAHVEMEYPFVTMLVWRFAKEPRTTYAVWTSDRRGAAQLMRDRHRNGLLLRDTEVIDGPKPGREIVVMPVPEEVEYSRVNAECGVCDGPLESGLQDFAEQHASTLFLRETVLPIASTTREVFVWSLEDTDDYCHPPREARRDAEAPPLLKSSHIATPSQWGTGTMAIDMRNDEVPPDEAPLMDDEREVIQGQATLLPEEEAKRALRALRRRTATLESASTEM